MISQEPSESFFNIPALSPEQIEEMEHAKQYLQEKIDGAESERLNPEHSAHYEIWIIGRELDLLYKIMKGVNAVLAGTVPYAVVFAELANGKTTAVPNDMLKDIQARASEATGGNTGPVAGTHS